MSRPASDSSRPPAAPSNLLIILSDEHNKFATGCYGHPLVRTPHLDRLAARGTRFDAAYTPCPICVPARASFATGRWVHDIGYWDNATAYDGRVPSWGHRLQAAGRRVVSIGKLHYVDSDPRRNGFDEEMLPLHIVDGVGDLSGLIRDELPVRPGSRRLGPEAARGESDYTRYDRQITDAACDWLRAATPGAAPWTLYVGLVAPHFPLVAPDAFFDLYPEQDVPWPKLYAATERPRHPWLDAMRKSLCYDEGFENDAMVRRAIVAYLGLVSFLDDNVGRMLASLEASGQAGNTRVIYSSDHGDNLGARGLWGKSTMYEESAGIPLILAGPGIPAGASCATPVSLVDVYPTVLECAGLAADPASTSGAALPGASLIGVANGATPDRTVLSEYHAVGAVSGATMIRDGDFKFIHYAGGRPPMLFDLANDPQECCDLGASPAFADVRARCVARLHALLDPEQVDRRARADQRQRIDAHGGRDAILAKGAFRFSPPPGVAEKRYASSDAAP